MSRSFEERKETPILGLERDLVPARATLHWGERTVVVPSPQAGVLRLPGTTSLSALPGRTTEAATHGSLDDDPALQQRIFRLIRES